MANEKGRPLGAALPPKTGGLRGREPLPSGKDLRADGDPGHGGGRPRLVARHRITSFQLLRQGVLVYEADASATSDLFAIAPLAPRRFRGRLGKRPLSS